MSYRKPEKLSEKQKQLKKLIEVFDTKTNKNVFISKDKLLEDEGRYSGVSGKIEELHNRLRKMSQDPKFTNEDREEIAREIRRIKGKVAGGSSEKKLEKAEGGIVKRYKGGLMVKPKAAKRGY